MVDAGTLVGLAIVAFAGGAFGAAVGGYPAFSLAGILIVVGEAATLAGRPVGPLGPVFPASGGATAITATLGLGPGLGPHVAFGGGVAAAAYAARRGVVKSDGGYHPAKNVTEALGARPDVLLAGGVFGVVGLLLAGLSGALSLPWYPVAFAIVGSGFLHRIAFGYPLVGDPDDGVLDMTPFERGARRAPRPHARSGIATGAFDRAAEAVESVGTGGEGTGGEGTGGEGTGGEGTGGGESGGEGTEASAASGGERTDADRESGGEGPPVGRYVVEPWLPHQYRWADVALLGFVVGVFGAFAVYRTGSVFLAFGLSAASLAFLCLGLDRMPVTYHMALPASIVVVGLAGGANPGVLAGGVTPTEFRTTVLLPVALVVGGGVGLIAGVAGELAQRVLYAHADTHLDPPAVGLVVATALVAVLDLLGVLAQTTVPTP